MKAIVLGCGRMGGRHIQALMNMNIDVVGLFDIRQEAADTVAREKNLAHDVVYASAEEAIARAGADLCVVATTAPSHKDYVLKSAAAGIKKILCEKPLATSIADCQAMIDTCAMAGADLAINHQMRFLEQYTLPKTMANSDAFGGLQAVTVTAGNFGMSMNGTHYVEMMRFLFDEEPSDVSAWFDDADLPNPRGPEFSDKSGTMRVRTKSGKVFTLIAGASQGHGLLVNYATRFGQIMVDELAGNLYATCRANPEDRALPTTRYGQPSSIETREIQAIDIIASTQMVLEALLTGKNYPSGAEAMLTVRTLAAAYYSNENGHRQIALDDPSIELEKTFPWA